MPHIPLVHFKLWVLISNTRSRTVWQDKYHMDSNWADTAANSGVTPCAFTWTQHRSKHTDYHDSIPLFLCFRACLFPHSLKMATKRRSVTGSNTTPTTIKMAVSRSKSMGQRKEHDITKCLVCTGQYKWRC